MVTALDTLGEKPYETFVGDGESAVAIGITALQGIRHAENALIDAAFITTLERVIEQWSSPVAKADLVALLRSRIPSFLHVETGKNLDQRI